MKINILCCFFSHIILGDKMVMVLQPIHSSAITCKWFHHYWERGTSSQGKLHILRQSVYRQISSHRNLKREKGRESCQIEQTFLSGISHTSSAFLIKPKCILCAQQSSNSVVESSLNNKNDIKPRWKLTVSVFFYFLFRSLSCYVSEKVSNLESLQVKERGAVSLKCRLVNIIIDTDTFCLSGLDKFVPLLLTNVLDGSTLWFRVGWQHTFWKDLANSKLFWFS